MQITQVRNATQLIHYANKRFLVDPMLADKGTYPGFPDSSRSHLYNPRVELPCDIERLLDIDAVILTHTHLDHWDDVAVDRIPKDMPIFVQNEHDRALLCQQGFTQLTVMGAATRFGDVTLTRTLGQHGSDAAYADPATAERMGDACGVIFRHADEGTLYLIGDSIWTPVVEHTLKVVQPDVVIANMGWAHIMPFGAIIMGAEDTVRIHHTVPGAQIVATHMEAINHCLMTRVALREFVRDNGVAEYVHIPEDGESVIF